MYSQILTQKGRLSVKPTTNSFLSNFDFILMSKIFKYCLELTNYTHLFDCEGQTRNQYLLLMKHSLTAVKLDGNFVRTTIPS